MCSPPAVGRSKQPPSASVCAQAAARVGAQRSAFRDMWNVKKVTTDRLIQTEFISAVIPSLITCTAVSTQTKNPDLAVVHVPGPVTAYIERQGPPYNRLNDPHGLDRTMFVDMSHSHGPSFDLYERFSNTPAKYIACGTPTTSAS